jgi:hypothetical protein
MGIKTGLQHDATIAESEVMLPIDIQSHYQQTIQTHAGVMIAPSVGSGSVFIDTNGFNEIAFTVANDATTATSIDVTWSHDGTSTQGVEYGVIPGTPRYKAINIPTKARYAKLTITNTDTAAHTISAWAYLKA